jgi:DNA-binding response OmpR family regulator
MTTATAAAVRTCSVPGDRNAVLSVVPWAVWPIFATRRRTIRTPVSDQTASVLRVLVIDDEAPIRLLCRVNLEAEGMEVLEAPHGLGGVELARTESPDVILLDVMMPGLDGWGVAEELLDDERTNSIPIVFLTARAELRDRARGLDLGGIDYITKPFNPVDLAPLVRGLLERVGRGERDLLRREKISELRQLIDHA